MDLEAAADALYALPPPEFTGARAQRVKAARAAGDRACATAIGGLRRPTTAAWLVNQLVRRRPADLGELADLGAALRSAHLELDGAALRTLSTRRHALLAQLVAGCRELAREAGQPVSDAVARELEEMFTAALADPAATARLTDGRLSSAKDLEAGGSPWPATDPSTRPRPASALAPAGSRPARWAEPGTPDQATTRALATARTELLRRAVARDEAQAAEAEALRALDAATGAEAAAHRAVAELRAELTAAEQREQRTRQAAGVARRARADAQRVLREAERRHAVAVQRLAAMGGDDQAGD